MYNLYELILSLCTQVGIRPGKMCNDLGLSRGMMTDLKMGRKQTLSADTLSKIAAYFYAVQASALYLFGIGFVKCAQRGYYFGTKKYVSTTRWLI